MHGSTTGHGTTAGGATANPGPPLQIRPQVTAKYDPLFASVRGFKGHVTRSEKELEKYLNFASTDRTNPRVGIYLEESMETLTEKINRTLRALDELSNTVNADDDLEDHERLDIGNKITDEYNELDTRKQDSTIAYLTEISFIRQAVTNTAPPGPPPPPALNPGQPRPPSRPVDALKPDKLTKNTAPVEFNSWCDRFRAYYDASGFVNLNVSTQQAYVYALLDEYLTQILRGKVDAQTPIFGDAGSVLAYLEEEFSLLYSTFNRRFEFFRMTHKPKQSFSEFLVQLEAMAVESDLPALNPEHLIVFRALTACSNKELAKKLLKLEEPSLNDLKKEVRLFEQVQSAFQALSPQSTNHVQRGRKCDDDSKKYKARATLADLKGKCLRCTSKKHKTPDCPRKDELVCTNCKKPGHVGPACLAGFKGKGKGKSKSQNSSRNPSRSSSPNNKSASIKSDDESPDTASSSARTSHVYCNAARGGLATPLIELETRLAGQKKKYGRTILAMPDSGTARSIIPLKMVQENGWSFNSLHTENMYAANKSTLKCAGQVNLEATFQGKDIAIDALVSPDVSDFLISWYNLIDLEILPQSFPSRLNVTYANQANSCANSTSSVSSSLSEKEFLTLYPDVLTDTLDKSKCMVGPAMDLKFKPGMKEKPCFIPTPRRVPLHLESAVKKFLDDAVHEGVLAKVDEPTEWLNYAFFIPKPNSERVRLVIDLRQLNKQILRPVFPFPSASDIKQSINHSATHFAKFDLLHGYHQVPLTHETSLKTAFLTQWGVYKYRRCPMGLKISGDFFCRVSDEALVGLEGISKIVDDILVSADSEDQLRERINALLTRCREKNIILSKNKFKIAQEGLKFAGFIVGASGVSPDPAKISNIKNFPTPQCVSDIRSFLGLVNQFSSFIPNLATSTDLLRSLLQKKNAFIWTEAHQHEFENVKSLLSQNLLTSHFNPAAKTVLVTDASRVGIGYMLMQTEEDGSNPRLIQCGGRSLTAPERNYAVVELELLASVHGIRQCRYYLQGTHFKIYSDHRGLVGLQKRPLPDIENARLLRLLLKIVDYDYEIMWVQGKKNNIADALSRHFPLSDLSTPPDDSVPANSILVNSIVSDPALSNLFSAAERDADYSTVVKAFQDNLMPKTLPTHHPAQMYANIWDKISLYGSLLIYDDHRIIVPPSELWTYNRLRVYNWFIPFTYFYLTYLVM